MALSCARGVGAPLSLGQPGSFLGGRSWVDPPRPLLCPPYMLRRGFMGQRTGDLADLAARRVCCQRASIPSMENGPKETRTLRPRVMKRSSEGQRQGGVQRNEGDLGSRSRAPSWKSLLGVTAGLALCTGLHVGQAHALELDQIGVMKETSVERRSDLKDVPLDSYPSLSSPAIRDTLLDSNVTPATLVQFSSDSPEGTSVSVSLLSGDPSNPEGINVPVSLASGEAPNPVLDISTESAGKKADGPEGTSAERKRRTSNGIAAAAAAVAGVSLVASGGSTAAAAGATSAAVGAAAAGGAAGGALLAASTLPVSHAVAATATLHAAEAVGATVAASALAGGTAAASGTAAPAVMSAAAGAAAGTTSAVVAAGLAAAAAGTAGAASAATGATSAVAGATSAVTGAAAAITGVTSAAAGATSAVVGATSAAAGATSAAVGATSAAVVAATPALTSAVAGATSAVAGATTAVASSALAGAASAAAGVTSGAAAVTSAAAGAAASAAVPSSAALLATSLPAAVASKAVVASSAGAVSSTVASALPAVAAKSGASAAASSALSSAGAVCTTPVRAVAHAATSAVLEGGAAAVTVAEAHSAAVLTQSGLASALASSAHHFVEGGVAGAVGATVVCPIDVVKTRMQGQETKKGEKPKYANPADCAIQILKEEGPGTFFQGLIPQLLGVAPEKAMKLTVNDLLMSVLESYIPGARLWTLELFAGSGGGLAQVVFTNPMEMVKIRQQMQGPADAGHAKKSALEIAKELGPTGLYQGSIATLLREIPSSAIFFGCYIVLKDSFPDQPFIAGCLAAAPSAFLCTPMDVVKTRMQMERKQGEAALGFWDTTQKIIREEGPKALFSGGLTRVLRVSPQFGITLAVYELLNHW